MRNSGNATTDFYKPGVISRLQKVGCHTAEKNSWCGEMSLRANDNDEEFLVGNTHWLMAVCKTYKISLTLIWASPKEGLTFISDKKV